MDILLPDKEIPIGEEQYLEQLGIPVKIMGAHYMENKLRVATLDEDKAKVIELFQNIIKYAKVISMIDKIKKQHA